MAINYAQYSKNLVALAIILRQLLLGAARCQANRKYEQYTQGHRGNFSFV